LGVFFFRNLLTQHPYLRINIKGHVKKPRDNSLGIERRSANNCTNFGMSIGGCQRLNLGRSAVLDG